MPRTIAELVHREVPLLHQDMQVGEALGPLLEAKLPALPVVGDDDRYAGIFGEHEFITVLFPDYVKNLGYAAFAPKSLEARSKSGRPAARSPSSST